MRRLRSIVVAAVCANCATAEELRIVRVDPAGAAASVTAAHRLQPIDLQRSSDLASWSTVLPWIRPGLHEGTRTDVETCEHAATTFIRFIVAQDGAILEQDRPVGAVNRFVSLSRTLADRHTYTHVELRDTAGNRVFESVAMEQLWVSTRDVPVELSARGTRTGAGIEVESEVRYPGADETIHIRYTLPWAGPGVGALDAPPDRPGSVALAEAVLPFLRSDPVHDLLLILPDGAQGWTVEGPAAPEESNPAGGDAGGSGSAGLRFWLPGLTEGYTGAFSFPGAAWIKAGEGRVWIHWTEITGAPTPLGPAVRVAPVVVHHLVQGQADARALPDDPDASPIEWLVSEGRHVFWLATRVQAGVVGPEAPHFMAHVGSRVELTIEGPAEDGLPSLHVAPEALAWEGVEGQRLPATMLAILNTGPGVSEFRIRTDSPWLSPDPVPGPLETGAEVEVRLHALPDGLVPGVYAAHALVEDPRHGMGVTVPVLLTLHPPAPPEGMSTVSGGVFWMGDAFGEGDPGESPFHEVWVATFFIDRHAVTRTLWDDVRTWGMERGYFFDGEGGGKAGDRPVHGVNWYDAVRWCNARSQMEGLRPVYYTDADCAQVYRTGRLSPHADPAADGYRLPTEAQWEKAARGGLAGRRFPWGDTIDHARANYWARAAAYPYDVSPYAGWTHHPDWFEAGAPPYHGPVDAFPANGYGLRGMAGNTWEWCGDWFDSDAYVAPDRPVADPAGPAAGTERVLRGGGWGSSAWSCRVAHRRGEWPERYGFAIGFRTVRNGP